jgi:competence protein ComEC
MGMVGFAATLAGSAASVRRLFLAAVLGMLLVKPAWLWDLGFQLSVAATAGMIWIVPVLKRRLSAWPPLAESLAASLATAPVLILNLGWERLSLTSIPANVLATPLVAPLMACSALAGGLGLLALPLGRFAAVLTRPLVSALLLIIDLSAAANEKLMAIFTG